MKMYVGNLSFNTTKQDLETLFADFGSVTDVHLPTDRESGRPRGFAFVTMDSKGAMDAAIKNLDGQNVDGRNIKVNEAQPREERGGGGGGGGYGGGGGGGGGYRRGGGGGGGRGDRDDRGGRERRY
ncbi:MAG TPA: RNA-binding protein [Verrucomicrobiales bacterium]|nr:RNA-binding protein [Verrucomicrobiales bacterium]